MLDKVLTYVWLNEACRKKHYMNTCPFTIYGIGKTHKINMNNNLVIKNINCI